MSPCSPPINSRHICNISFGDTEDNHILNQEELSQETLVRPVRPCPIPRLLSCLQEACVVGNTCHSFCIRAIKTDPCESAACRQPVSQCDNTGDNCDILRSVSKVIYRVTLANHFHRNQKLQHGMAQRANNPPQNDEPQNDSGFGSGGCVPIVAFNSALDLDKLNKNCEELSQCDFYYGSIDSQTSRNLLRKKPNGTFLIRDSSDSRYLYSLSVKTEKGATSIRVLYNNGLFQFDSDKLIRHKLPRFNSVLALLDFHVKATEEGNNTLWRWEEISGCKSLSVVLTKPLANSVPSLAHLSRVRINQCLNKANFSQTSIHRLPLHSDDVDFLGSYPYII